MVGVYDLLNKMSYFIKRTEEISQYDKFKKDWFEKLQNSQKYITSHS